MASFGSTCARSRRLARLVAWVGLCAIAGAALGSPAMAQSPDEKAQAQVLFDEARALIGKGKTAQACDKFAASYDLDPAMGTQLNLAVCYEKLGRIASAWVVFIEIQTTARRAGQQRRAEFARKKAAALAPKLSRLRIDVSQPVAGLTITRDDRPLTKKVWGSPVPIDPGEHLIEAKAPGKKPWTTKITVGAERDEVTLEVPALEDAPVPVTPAGGKDHGDAKPAAAEREAKREPKGGPDTGGSSSGVPLALGWTAMGTGVASLSAGVVLRLLALGTDKRSNEHCLPDNTNVCTQEGADLRDEAQLLQTGSTIAWIAGGALLVGGIVLVVTAPSDEQPADTEARLELRPVAGPGGAAMLARVRW